MKNANGDMFCVDMFNYIMMACLDVYKLEIVGNHLLRSEILELCK